ncbi:MAG: DUF4199 domain-containing protein [Gemmatimonadaceae bacterium]|nr:DUF4199 domain-containing protein [Gemmatimonadaceae bacterium]
MRHTVVRYGFMAGGILSALMVTTLGIGKLIGWEDHGYGGMAVGYTTMVLSFMLIHFGVRSYRDTVTGGEVRFWPALRVGLLIAVIGSACYSATWLVVGEMIMPNFAEKYGAEAVKQAETRGAPPAEVEKIRTEMASFAAMYKNPVYKFGMTILEPLPVGVLMSLISATVLSRRRKGAIPATGGLTT